MTLSEPILYKKHTKKMQYIQQIGRGTIYMALFTFTSVVQILDYVDKNHTWTITTFTALTELN